MTNSSYYIAPVGDRTHDHPHTVASNMVKVSHALNHSATEAVDFTKAFALAQSMELAARNVQDMKHQSHVNTPKMSAASPLGHINKLATHKVGQTVKPCDRCGCLNHTSPQCRFKDVTCRNCGKV